MDWRTDRPRARWSDPATALGPEHDELRALLTDELRGSGEVLT